MCELYMRTKGNVKTDIFNYTFGHREEEGSKEQGVSKEGMPESRRV